MTPDQLEQTAAWLLASGVCLSVYEAFEEAARRLLARGRLHGV